MPLMVLLAGLSQLATLAAQPPPTLRGSEVNFIVTLRRDADCARLCGEFRLQPGRHYRHAFNGFVSRMDADCVARLKRDPRVLAVERDGPVETCAQTNGAGIVRMGVDQFPMARINGVDERIDVDVAVLDTGIDATHPDLNVVQSVDFTGDGQNGADWHGHGTHVAGIIGALDNDFGVVGVAPGARIWNVQVLGPTNSDWAQVLAGMDYVAQHADEIEVLNASFTNTRSDAPWTAIHEAVLNIVNQGVVFVAATGNNQQDLRGSDRFFGSPTNTNGGDDKLPASLEEVMAVSAIDPMNDKFPSFSNFSQRPHAQSFVSSPGAAIDVAAPGVGIYSCDKGGGYTNRNGTSMACAHVSGLIALYIAANSRAYSASEVYAIRQKLIDTALPETEWQSYPLVMAQDANPEGMARPSESWIPAPRFTQQHQTSQGFESSFTTVPGYFYTLQSANLLPASNLWAHVVTTNGTGGVMTVNDPGTGPQRFHRVKRTVLPPDRPTISAQPRSTNAPMRAEVSFNVAADGIPALHYQWQFQGAALQDDARHFGSRSNQLWIVDIAVADAGDYRVVISNAYGSVISTPANLGILDTNGQMQAMVFNGGSASISPGYVVGWAFTVSSTVTVRSLGWFDAGADGLVGSHEVGIFTRPASGSGSLLVSTTVSTGDALVGSYRYKSIPDLVLSPGEYVVAGPLGSDGYQAFCGGVTMAPQIIFAGGRQIPGNSLAYPSLLGDQGIGYFGPNFLLIEEGP